MDFVWILLTWIMASQGTRLELIFVFILSKLDSKHSLSPGFRESDFKIFHHTQTVHVEARGLHLGIILQALTTLFLETGCQ